MKAIYCVMAGVALAASSASFAADGKKDIHSNAGMEAALVSLDAAMASLQSDTGDKGGHRRTAMELLDQAIEEVHVGIDFDNENLSPAERGIRAAERAKVRAQKAAERAAAKTTRKEERAEEKAARKEERVEQRAAEKAARSESKN